MALNTYVWDQLNDSYLAETDGAGASTAVYTQEPGQYGGLVSQRRSTATSFFHCDSLGSTRSIKVDANRNIIRVVQYLRRVNV